MASICHTLGSKRLQDYAVHTLICLWLKSLESVGFWQSFAL
jgi:hypothetical protein